MSQTTHCFNTANKAMSTWTNIAFSRIWRVGNKYYGIRESGIYELTGNTDDGVEYPSIAILRKNNLGTSKEKRLPYIRIDSSAEGFVGVTADAEASTSPTEFTVDRRVKLGRGLKGRWLSVNLASQVAGFEVYSIELFPQVLTRGVK